MRYREIEPEDIAWCGYCQEWHVVSLMASAAECKQCHDEYMDDLMAMCDDMDPAEARVSDESRLEETCLGCGYCGPCIEATRAYFEQAESEVTT